MIAFKIHVRTEAYQYLSRQTSEQASRRTATNNAMLASRLLWRYIVNINWP